MPQHLPLRQSPRTSGLRRHLALGYALLLIYASLSPFSGWQEQGITLAEVLAAPLAQTYTAFDAASNLLAYTPLGALIAAWLGPRWPVAGRVLVAGLLGAALSGALEFLQLYLPSRVSSNADWLGNSVGAVLGALLATQLFSGRLAERGLQLFRQWFPPTPSRDFGLAWLSAWAFAQTNPALPMLGTVFISVSPPQPFAPAAVPLDGFGAGLIALNLLMVGGLLWTLTARNKPWWAALLAVLGGILLIKFLLAALLLKSWALWLWLSSEVMLGLVLGLALLGAVLLFVPQWMLPTVAAAASAYALLALLLTEAGGPTVSLYGWRYGHLLNYNGLAQTVLLLFPFMLLWHLFRHSSGGQSS